MTKLFVPFILLILILSLFTFPVTACTTLLVTKGASEDGSVFVAHSDDSELFDQRLVFVPAADYKQGELRPVYYDPASLGDKPEYNSSALTRYVGTHRGPTYSDPNKPQSIPLGYIPQVEHTYAYFDGSYAIMNEHQLMFGECTNGSKVQREPEPGKRIFYSAELSRVAAERCKTAREAIHLIGELIDTYGYYGTGETLLIADTKEGWVMEMAPSPDEDAGLWVAKKVPDGEVFVAANEFRIREINPDDPDLIYSRNLHEVAQKHGWWKPEDGDMDWLRTVSLGEYNHPYYSLRRVWRLQSKIAPSKKLSPRVEDGYTKLYPFSVKPDKKLNVRDVMNLYRDYYQDTEFDLSKDLSAGPFGCPYRYPGPKDPKGDTGDPNVKREGAWERPISIFRCGYSYVCQGRDWLPDPIGGIVWFGPDEPMSTCFVPFYVGVEYIAKPYYTCDTTKFDQNSAWWVFNFVANWAALKYSYMIKDIIQMQDQIELAEIQNLKSVEKKALALYKKSPKEAKKYLTEYCETQANQVVAAWWEFAWLLVARYDDGYINAPDRMVEEVGYPDSWYEKTNWYNGPVKY
ncbi:MAG TPA: dipeptidase [Firmicutes bacterium]|nr:dipeptidase [Bacillota bacterium]